MKRILDYLPPLYQGLLPAVFRREIPPESLSTCEDCAMCRRPGEPRIPEVSHFKPDARCCTFYPSLPNYLVGGLLADSSAAHREGRRRVRQLLHESPGAGPFALASPRCYDLRYALLGERGFGRRRSLLCPYFRRGSNDCSIWGFRNSVCATYFCHPVRGIPGAAFWRAVHRYLAVLEEALAAYALRLQDRPAEPSRKQAGAGGSGGVDASRVAIPVSAAVGTNALERVYHRAHEIVRDLSPRAVAHIGGEPARSALVGVKDSLREMLAATIPPRLRTNPALRATRRREQVYLRVPGHISYRLEARVWDALQSFDGSRECKTVVRDLDRLQGLALTSGFLLALYRGGILIPCVPARDPLH